MKSGNEDLVFGCYLHLFGAIVREAIDDWVRYKKLSTRILENKKRGSLVDRTIKDGQAAEQFIFGRMLKAWIMVIGLDKYINIAAIREQALRETKKYLTS